MNRIHVSILALALLTLQGCVTKRAADGGEAGRAGAAAPESAEARAAAATERDRLQALRAHRTDLDDLDTATLRATVRFEYDSHEVRGAERDQLREKARVLRAHEGVRLRIEGHADVRGSAEYNLALGQRRANAVREYLEAHGVARSRLSTLSWGRERPAVAGGTEAAHAQNRRAEFVVLSGT